MCSFCDQPVDEGLKVCEVCLNAARSLLAESVIMFYELPAHLGHVRASMGNRPGGTDGRPLPGGDLLVLLGPGSRGLSDDGETRRRNDPDSVPYKLSAWEERWRSARGEEPAGPTEVWRAAQYLRNNLRWASVSLKGFSGFLGDLRALHGRLETATGRRRSPVKANADCFSCGEPLLRLVGSDGLEEQHVTCRGCGQKYDATRYLLALRAAAEDASSVIYDDEAWETADLLARRLARSVHTLRAWRRLGHVRAHSWGGVVFLSVEDVEREHAARLLRA